MTPKFSSEGNPISESKDGDVLGRRNLLKGLALAGVAGAGELMAAPSGGESAGSAPAMRSPRVEQWGLQEVALRSEKVYENPFKEVQLQGVFNCGDKTVTVDGFYDGDSTWRIRLMPERQGHWGFTTKSNDTSLNGRTGEFDVITPSRNNHGPVNVAKKFHFSYADGTPFYPLGTTTYGLFLGVLEAQVSTVGMLSQSAFNKARINVMSFSSLAPSDSAFLRTSGTEHDFDRYNVDFFRRYEAGLLDLQAIGVEADMILFHPYDSRGKFSSLPQEQDEAYIRYAVARLSAYRNVWWTLTNEFDLFPMHGVVKDWKRLGELLAASDPYGHLRGIHNSSVGFYDNSEGWITHVILQDITLQRLTAEPRNNSAIGLDARKIGKPVVIDEYGYEGTNGLTWGSIAPREAVDFHWSIVMAGAYGSHGESYYRTPRGTYVGESPARLAFLKKVMLQTPYQDIGPLTDVIAVEDPAINVLGASGVCYLFHFSQPKRAATWNRGFFGPATPSQPLPIKANSFDPNSFASAPPKFTIQDGLYRVELIDCWQMNIHHMGFTSGASQQFRSSIVPGLVRLTRVESVSPDEKLAPIAQLLTRDSSAS